MKILCLSPFLPFPLTQGGKILIHNFLTYFGQHHEVTLVCFVEEKGNSDIGDLKTYCKEILLVKRKENKIKDGLLFLFGSRPYNFVKYSSAEMRQVLTDLAGRERFDIVQIEFPMMFQYAGIFHGVPVVLNTQNVEYLILRQLMKRCRNPLLKGLYWMEYTKFKRLEEDAWRRAGLCLAISDAVRETILNACPPEKKNQVVSSAGGGIDCKIHEYRFNERDSQELLFIGDMEYHPSADACFFLLQEVFPLISSRMPEVRLKMVGRRVDRLLRLAEKYPNVELLSNVREIAPYFYGAHVMIVPLRMGGGIRIKILEALARGLPVVSTSLGCEGIGLEDGKNAMIADSAEELAEKTLRLLTEKELRRQISIEGRRHVEAHYSSQLVMKKIEEEYKTLLP